MTYFNENLFSDAAVENTITVDEEEAQLLNALSDEDEESSDLIGGVEGLGDE